MKVLAMIGLAALLAVTPQKNINKDKNPMILDVDFSCDVDDIAAVRLATQLDKEDVIDLEAVMLNTNGNEKALHGLLTEDGYPNMKIGTASVTYEDGSTYREVLEAYSKGKIKQADSVQMYKYVLYRSQNKVKIVTTGFLTNIHKLLQDEVGYKLVKEKVEAIYITGGVGYSNNMVHHKEAIDATRYVLLNCPCPIVMFGDEIGHELRCGASIYNNHKDDPMAKAFQAYSDYWNGYDLTEGRYAWDPFTVYVAAYGYDKTMTVANDSRATYYPTSKTIEHSTDGEPNCKRVSLVSDMYNWYSQELDEILERRYQ